MKPDGIHCGDFCDSWNGKWEAWMKEHEKATPEQIEEYLKQLRKEFGIGE